MKNLIKRLSAQSIAEASQPHLNKQDPGSLLARTVYLLEKNGLDEAADKVRGVSRDVSKAWMGR
jgi:hypothetical protein